MCIVVAILVATPRLLPPPLPAGVVEREHNRGHDKAAAPTGPCAEIWIREIENPDLDIIGPKSDDWLACEGKHASPNPCDTCTHFLRKVQMVMFLG